VNFEPLQSKMKKLLFRRTLPALLLATAVTGWGKGVTGADFTTFEFPGDPGAARWYDNFTRSFFTNRINLEPTIFPREYLAVADCWLNDARRGKQSIQEFHREHLLGDMLDPEGYVLTRQHGAFSHDHGWPLGHWSQVPGPGGSKGVTAGWHFSKRKHSWDVHYEEVARRMPERVAEGAIAAWNYENLRPLGINAEKNALELKTTGGFPAMTSPEGVTIDPFNAPYMQIRWNTGSRAPLRPYMEWQREGDKDWSESRRMYFYPDWLTGDGRSDTTGMFHSILPLHRHPEWNGKITRLRFRLAAEERPPDIFFVNSIFTTWDTRHLVNNGIYIKAAFEYFRWTGDLDFLRTMLPRLRQAMNYLMEEGHGRELKHIRCTWPGHDGRPGYTIGPDGKKTFRVGRGKGGNYWDLLPFGWDDMYTTTHYYGALLAMAQMEEAAASHPGWAMPGGFTALSPEELRAHAAEVKRTVNEKFWNPQAGRFVGTIDADGVPRDYGFTFVNLEAVHYGLADEKNAREIMAWINGSRTVEGDTSTGADIYAYRLAPRATTKRNVDWYGHLWTGPETLPFGGQVQDGGAVLGFSFYDIMSRLRVLGPDDAWARLMAIRAWNEEVQAHGGYRKYYADGKGGTTLQGGGTAGGIGIDFEFTESSMLAAVVPVGFMGLRPDGNTLHIEPRLPAACPEMTVRNILYQGIPLDITVSADAVKIIARQKPPAGLPVEFRGQKITIDDAGSFEMSAATADAT
jgi:hypothetical protein